MGNFYTNLSVKISGTDAVATVMKSAQRSAFVSPASGGYVVVFDEAAEQQDAQVIEQVGVLLSDKLRCPVFAVLNHDDDILCYWLFDNGQQIDAYNSCPNYWDDSAGTDRGGDVDLLCDTLGVPEANAQVKSVLYDEEYTFALEQHTALVAALHIPESTVCGGFTYIEQDELPEGLSMDTLVRTP